MAVNELPWFTALRVVDRRRAFFIVVMLALYPIFNFKGFKYNPDLLQLVTLPLLVLAYLNAFENRDVRSGILLGLAGALVMLVGLVLITTFGGATPGLDYQPATLRDGQSIQAVASTDPVTGEVVKIDVTLNLVK
mgnify:CR=1 FL=1